MKVGTIIGIVVAALVAVGAIGYAAYSFGHSQGSKAHTSSNTNNNSNSSNSSNSNSNNVQPKVVTDPTCNADELSLALGQGNGAGAGTGSFSLVFTNTGSRECTLYGYPGVSLVNDNGNQIGSPADRASGATENTVTLKPSASTSSLVTYALEESNFDPGTCKDGAAKVRVYPPNDYGYLSIASPITYWCPGFMVWPVTAQ